MIEPAISDDDLYAAAVAMRCLYHAKARRLLNTADDRNAVAWSDAKKARNDWEAIAASLDPHAARFAAIPNN